jgi:hypothetical protein
MQSGLLVLLALFLTYLAVSGKYTCVTAAARCVFGGKKLCACGAGAQGAAQQKPVAGQAPDAVRAGIGAVQTILQGARDVIDAARGR